MGEDAVGSGLPMQCCIIGELNEQPTMAEYGQGASLLPHNQAGLCCGLSFWQRLALEPTRSCFHSIAVDSEVPRMGWGAF